MKRTPLKRKPPKPKKPKPRQIKTTLLDRLFSLYVRARSGWKCEASNWPGTSCSKRLECAHGISRRFFVTRWDPENAWCLCSAHHRWFHECPNEWVEFVEKSAPGRWDDLKRKRQSTEKTDRDRTEFFLKERLKGMGVNWNKPVDKRLGIVVESGNNGVETD